MLMRNTGIQFCFLLKTVPCFGLNLMITLIKQGESVFSFLYS